MHDLIRPDVYSRLPERYRRRARRIAERAAEIAALMTPGQPDDVRDAVVRLRQQFRPQPDTDPMNMAAEFKAACADIPAWALSEAANDFLAGRVDNHTGQYMPTCAEFAIRARFVMHPFLAEHAALRTEASKLLERAIDDDRRAKIEMERQDPSVRKRVAAMVDDALAGLPKPQPMRHTGLSDDRQRKLDALKKPQRPFESKIAQTRIGDVIPKGSAGNLKGISNSSS